MRFWGLVTMINYMCVNWQGTTMFFSAFTDWKVDELVKSATLLSPIAFLKHMTTLVGNIAAHAYLGEVCVF